MRSQDKEEELYTAIGQYLIDSLAASDLEDKWEKVVLKIEHTEYVTNYEADYIFNGISESLKLILPTITSEIKELKQFTEENNYTPWNKLIFELSPDNKFSIDYQWDDTIFDT